MAQGHRFDGESVQSTGRSQTFATPSPASGTATSRSISVMANGPSGMAHQGFLAHPLRRSGRGWRATFYTTGMEEHSPTSATGTAWEGTPWHATQRAAREALDRARGRSCTLECG